MFAILLAGWVVTLNWDANPPEQSVTGYNVYVNGSWVGESGDTEHVLNDVDLSTQKCFTVSAYNISGEGEQSSPVCAQRPNAPGQCMGLTVRVQ